MKQVCWLMDNTLKNTQRLYDRNEEEIQESQKKYGGVYISRVEEDDGLNLEVETESGHVAFTLKHTAESFVDGATQDSRYQELVDFLESNEVSVFEDHDEWEEVLAMESDDESEDDED